MDWLLKYTIHIAGVLFGVLIFILALRFAIGEWDGNIELIFDAFEIAFYLFIMFLVPAIIARIVQAFFFKSHNERAK